MQENKEKTLWITPEEDFEDLYRDGRYNDIIRLSKENADLMTSFWRCSETGRLKKSLNIGMVMLSYFERSLQEDEKTSSIFGAGKLKGCIETLDKLQFASDQDKLAEERAKWLGTKHLDKIIFALETHGSMTQSELGESLGLQSSTLSETLKKIRRTQLIQVSSYGKYNLYSLTGEGIRYGALIRKKIRHQTEMENAIETLCSYLKDPDMRPRCLNMLNGKLSETSDTIVSIDDQVVLMDDKRKNKTKMKVKSVLQEIVNSETASIEPKKIFVGKYYQTDENDLENKEVSLR